MTLSVLPKAVFNSSQLAPPALPVVAFSGEKTTDAVLHRENTATNADKSKKKSPSFLNVLSKEGVKNAATVGVTLLLAPLLGPALAGVVGGGKVLSTVVFGLLVPAATEYGLLKFEGNTDKYKLWLGKQIYQPAKKVIEGVSGSFLGKAWLKRPKAWADNLLEKLNPDTLTKVLKEKNGADTAVVGKQVSSKNPFKGFLAQFRQHKGRLGFGPALLVSLHKALDAVRQQFSIKGMTKGKLGCSMAGCSTVFRAVSNPKSLRLGLAFKQLFIANTVVWGAMKAVNVAAKWVYGKPVQQLIPHQDSGNPSDNMTKEEVSPSGKKSVDTPA